MLKGGFFDAVNGDRKYSAEDFNRIFKGILTDGIVRDVGQEFQVSGNTTGNTVTVAAGRAMCNGLWIENDTPVTIDLGNPDNSSNRYDAVVLCFDKGTGVRENTIQVIKGQPRASGHQPPSIYSNDTKAYLVLAYVDRRAGEDGTRRLTDLRGTYTCPWVKYPEGTIRPHNLETASQILGASDLFVLGQDIYEDAEPAKTRTAQDVARELLKILSPWNANLIYEDRNLGSQVTSQQLQDIRSGAFTKLNLGNYWLINGVKWRIVDFDYFYQKGQNPLPANADHCTKTKHHVVIMPDTCLYRQVRLHSSSSTDGGYTSFEVRKVGKPLRLAYNQAVAAFGEDKLMWFPHYMYTGADGGYPTATYFQYEKMVLPSLRNLTVSSPFMIQGQQTHNNTLYFHTVNHQPFAAFMRNHSLLLSDDAQWLTDLANHNSVIGISREGVIVHMYITMAQAGIRPYIVIG